MKSSHICENIISVAMIILEFPRLNVWYMWQLY